MQWRGTIKKPSSVNPNIDYMLAFNGGSFYRVMNIFRGKYNPSFDDLAPFGRTSWKDDQKERDFEGIKPGFYVFHRGS